jgi:hypothetical protein
MATTASRDIGDRVFTDNITFLKAPGFVAPCIGDAAVLPATNINADKLTNRFRATFNQVDGSVSATERRAIFWAFSTGTVRRVNVGSVVANAGAATVTVDIKKNGTTILSGVVTLNSSNTACIAVAGTITVPGLVAGDVLECVVVAAAGGGTLGQGLFVFVDIDENGV